MSQPENADCGRENLILPRCFAVHYYYVSPLVTLVRFGLFLLMSSDMYVMSLAEIIGLPALGFPEKKAAARFLALFRGPIWDFFTGSISRISKCL